MPKGGTRPGAGRKPGSKTKKTALVAQRAAEAGITPLEYMLRVMRDEGAALAERMDAAKASAPYVHPRLSAVELSLSEVNDEDLRSAAR